MQIQFSKKFEKQLKKQPNKVRSTLYRRLDVFLIDKYDPILNNHALQGKYMGLYSINITGDVRALYYEKDDTLIIFAFIGSHSQLYG